MFEEVELSSNQRLEKKLRVDLLAVTKAGGRILGLEVKRGFYKMSEYAAAIKQAADCSLGFISDTRLTSLEGVRVSGGFVFPRWSGGHDREREYCAEAYGMERLSHHFRVGFGEYGEGSVALFMEGKKRWSSGAWSGNAPGILGGKERIGSGKVIDPARYRP